MKHKDVRTIINSENNKSETPLILANTSDVAVLLENASSHFTESASIECRTGLHSRGKNLCC